MIAGYDKHSIQYKEEYSNIDKVNYFELINEPHVYVLARDVASYATEFRFSLTTDFHGY